MASIKQLRSRVAGIKTIAKITKTMRMIASTELLKYKKLLLLAEERKNILSNSLFSLEKDLLASVSTLWESQNYAKKEIKKVAVIFGSDRGLCGGFNSKILKVAQNYTDADQIIIVGKKIFARIVHQNITYVSSADGIRYMFQVASQILNILLTLSEKYSLRCDLIYSNFLSSVNYELIEKRILPVCNNVSSESGQLQAEIDDTEFVKRLSIDYLGAVIYQALLSSKASEEVSRVLAMDGATKNSDQLTDLLTLKMNKIRQSNITGELIEIISSSQAL